VLSSRSAPYALLARAFSFPDVKFHESVVGGHWENDLRAALEALPCRFRTSNLAWLAPATYDEMQSEYIRLFQIGGRRGPPCPLHEGHYTRDRSRTLQHLIRFYNYFGYGVVECVMPDHLPVQLEFMSELASSEDAGALRAQRDFLRTHLAWSAELAERVAAARPCPFYRSLTQLTCRLVAADQGVISTALGDHFNGRI
jgi:DMSO reductase family type II enzyme chaperone